MKRTLHSVLALALFLLVRLPAVAQDIPRREIYATWEEFTEEFRAVQTDEGEETTSFPAAQWEELEKLQASPFRLNTVCRDELLRLPFLTEAQADSLLAYRQRKGRVMSLGELLFVRNLDHDTRRWLSLFVCAGPEEKESGQARRSLSRGRHEVETRLDIPFYRREGELTDDEARGYRGNGLANVVRYRYDRQREMRWGATFQKDAGEPFARYGNRPFDYTSAYFALTPDRRPLSLWLGDYEVQAGEGLLLGGRRFGGRVSLLRVLPRGGCEVRPHTSTDEFHYFRGAALGLRHGGWDILVFLSRRKLDGRLEGDTLRSFKTDGLHRTPSELERRAVEGAFVAGGRVARQWRWGKIGMTGLWGSYEKPVMPVPTYYNTYYLRGTRTAGLSADYALRLGRWQVQGETAVDRSGHVAATHAVRYEPSARLVLTLAQRSFSSRFVAPYGQTLQQASRVANEHGLFLGLRCRPFGAAEAEAYIDLYRFPRPVYRSVGPSDGLETFVRLRQRLGRRWALQGQYRMKTQARDVSGHAGLSEYVATHRLRLQADLHARSWTACAALDGAAATSQTASATYGWMVSSRLNWHPSSRWTAAAFAALFFTDDYASRLYAYEPQLRYAASFPVFFRHGVRVVAQAAWRPVAFMRIAVRYGLLGYFDREGSGSGLQHVDSSVRSDLSVQLQLVL